MVNSASGYDLPVEEDLVDVVAQRLSESWGHLADAGGDESRR
jgi:hypothetical protein